MGRVQLPQGCKATSKEQPSFKFSGGPGSHFMNLNGWKAELTMKSSSGFEPKTLRLVIQYPNH